MIKTPDSIPSPAPQPPAIRGKLGLIVGLLARPEGADLGEMMEATGWQEHSIRGALAGALKKNRGLSISSDKPGNVRVYRLSAAPPTSALTLIGDPADITVRPDAPTPLAGEPSTTSSGTAAKPAKAPSLARLTKKSSKGRGPGSRSRARRSIRGARG
jgi:Protein of unknown function (DUF3489)